MTEQGHDAAKAREHIPALDGLRGSAVILVVLYHFFHDVNTNPVFGLGWTGVDLFFVLSGFLITGILYQSKGSRSYYGNFLMRRVLRVMPLYFLVLGLVSLATLWSDHPGARDFRATELWYWTFTQNLLQAFHGWSAGYPALGHFWSLAIEEQFYLVWPWLVLWLSPKWILRACVAGVILSPVLRVCVPEMPFAYVFTFCRLEGLLLGSVIAMARISFPKVLSLFGRGSLLLALLVLAACNLADWEVDFQSYWMSRAGYTAIALAYASVLVIALRGSGGADPFQRLMTSSIMRSIGKYSYGIYIYHNLLFWSFRAWFGSTSWSGTPGGTWLFYVLLVVLMFATYGLAWLSYEYYERFFLRLKDRFTLGAQRLA